MGFSASPAGKRSGVARTLVIVFLVAAAGCTSPGPSRAPSPPDASQPSASPNRVLGWRSDLQQLLPAMEALHPNLYHGTSKPVLQEAIRELESRVPSLDDDQVMVGVLRIVAMV